jgi:prepilin-type N-terminal cleavage/methylation domain-containing protein
MELEVTIMKNIRMTSMKNKGFTLIELLIALAVFSLVIVSMATAAISVIKSQRKAFALQNTQEASRYLLETMSKEIRMSAINSSAGSGLTVLNITNAQNETFDYQFDNTNKQLLRWGQPISPANLEVTGSFYVRKGTFPSRAVVTIVMQTKSKGAKAEEQAEIYLQSTLSSRAW